MRTFDVTNTAGGVALNADGGFLVTGRTNAQVNAYFMIRTDPQGNTYWRRDFGAYPKSTQQVRLAADGNILTWATHNTTWAPGVQDTVNSRLSCWSQNNTLLWFKDIGSIWYPTTNDFEVLQDGSVITGGSWNYMFRLIKFGPQGDSLWTSAYILLGGPCILADVEGTSDGGYIATGWAMQTLAHGDPTPGIPTTIVLKLDSMGCLIPGCQNVGVHEQVLDLQDALSVFPNPSAGPFVLELTLPSSLELLGTLQAVVVDAVGREVYRQGHGTQLQQRFTVDLSGNPPGLYYLHMATGRP